MMYKTELDVRDFDQMTEQEQRAYVAWGLNFILENLPKAPTNGERFILQHLHKLFDGGRLN